MLRFHDRVQRNVWEIGVLRGRRNEVQSLDWTRKRAERTSARDPVARLEGRTQDKWARLPNRSKCYLHLRWFKWVEGKERREEGKERELHRVKHSRAAEQAHRIQKRDWLKPRSRIGWGKISVLLEERTGRINASKTGERRGRKGERWFEGVQWVAEALQEVTREERKESLPRAWFSCRSGSNSKPISESVFLF